MVTPSRKTVFALMCKGEDLDKRVREMIEKLGGMDVKLSSILYGKGVNVNVKQSLNNI